MTGTAEIVFDPKKSPEVYNAFRSGQTIIVDVSGRRWQIIRIEIESGNPPVTRAWGIPEQDSTGGPG